MAAGTEAVMFGVFRPGGGALRHLFAYQPGNRVKQKFARRNRIESCRVDSDGDRARVERLTTTAATSRSAMSMPGEDAGES